jgi:acetyltransferase
MGFRALEHLFRPRSVALIGADRAPRSVGAVLAGNLFGASFDGPVMPVHASLAAVRGVMTYPTVAALPIAPDLAVIAAPPDAVPPLIVDLGVRGTKVAVVLSAGFEHGGIDAGRALRGAMRSAAATHGMRLVGPACLGVIVPGIGLNASYAHRLPPPGDVAIVTQSGSLASVLLDLSADRGIGFSLLASLGDMDDVDFADVLDYLAIDPTTRAVLLVVDDIADARSFMSAARTVARIKPVIVYDAGRVGDGTAAAADGCRAEPGVIAEPPRDAVFDAAFRRAGMLPVTQVSDLIAAAGTLDAGTRMRGDRLAVISNGHSVGALSAVLWRQMQGRLATISEAAKAALDAVLPVGWSGHNPVNVFQDATAARYAAAVEALLACPETDNLLVVVAPTAVGDTLAVAEAIAARLPKRRKPLAVAWMDTASRAAARTALTAARVPVHDLPRLAITAFAHLLAYARNQEMLTQTPASLPDLFERDVAGARAAVAAARAAGRTRLNDDETAAVLGAYGLPLAERRTVATAEEAARAAAGFGFPVALKLLTRVPAAGGAAAGLVLALEDEASVLATAQRLRQQALAGCPDAPQPGIPQPGIPQPDPAIAGFSVMAMASSVDAEALRLAVVSDRRFGPVVLFGAGGGPSALLRDEAVGLPPLNLALARLLIAETRVSWLLQGAGGRPPADLDEVALSLVRISQMAIDLDGVAAIDINPLLADSSGVVVLSAEVRVAAAVAAGDQRFAIRPYPVELEKTVTTRSGKTLWLRPIRPEDEPALQAFIRRMSSEDLRMRFFSPLKELDHGLAARLTQIDYDREMAFVAVDPAEADGEIWGTMRISADADLARGEYAGSVRSDLQGHGLGRLLLEEIIAYARAHGIGEVWGEVLAENAPMLGLCRKLGFTLRRDEDDPALIHVSLPLQAS